MPEKEFNMINENGRSQTLHLRLYNYLRSAVEAGEYKKDQMIPSENKLCAMFSMSRTTVRNVLNQLVSEKLLYRIPGKGTFVAGTQITTLSIACKGIREQLEEKGYQTDTELLSAEQTAAADHIAKALQLPLESQVFVIKRLRCVNGAPLSLHTSYIPSDLCPELLSDDLETTALCHILEQRYDISPLRGEESLESLNASAPQAKLLGVKPGAGLLYLECTMYSTQNRPYLLDKVFFRGDSIKLQFSYQRELQLSSLK